MKRLASLLCALVAATIPGAGCKLLDRRWDVAWQRGFEASGYNYVDAHDMAGAPDGGVMVVGSTTNWGAAEYDGLVIRLDGDGNERTLKLYGGPYTDELRTVRAVPAGGYIACGDHAGRAWLLRLDENGDTVWTRDFGDSASATNGWAAVPTSDGGFAAIGYFGSSGQGEWFRMIRTDATGAELWRSSLDSLPLEDAPVSLYEEPDHGFLISSYPLILIRTDANGDTLWTRQYSLGMNLRLCPATDGGCYGVGMWSPSSFDSQYVVTARFDAHGDTLWTRNYREDFVVTASNVAVTPDGGCAVFGTLGTTIEGGNESHVLVLKYASDGRLEWDHTLGSDRSSCGAGTIDADGWFTLAVEEEPLNGPERLTLVRTRP